MQQIQREKPCHSYSGEKWKTNKTNKKYLRIDFHKRCAYCDDADFYHGGMRGFHVDHFAPKEKFPSLVHMYENLLYACPYCNEAKSDKWPSDRADINIIGDEGFVNPCTTDYDNNLERDDGGKIVAKTKLGEYMILELKLYLWRHELFYKIDQVNLKREQLKDIISERKMLGKDVTIYEKTLKDIDEDFFTYYSMWKELESDS